MNCYVDSRPCTCKDTEHCSRDPFRDGDSMDELEYMEFVTGHRTVDETRTIFE